MENNKIERPLILEIDEAKKEIVDVINNASQKHGVPFYVLEMILSGIYRQVSDAAKMEFTEAQSYVSSETQTKPEDQ